MTLLEFYDLVVNDNKDFNTLYVAVGFNCKDGEVYYEPTDPTWWSYRFVERFHGTAIYAFTSTHKNSGDLWPITVWLASVDSCSDIVDNYKPTPHGSFTVNLFNNDIDQLRKVEY